MTRAELIAALCRELEVESSELIEAGLDLEDGYDTSARKVAMQEAKIELERSRRKYLLGLAHDIRTSLNVIDGSSEIALAHTDDVARVTDCLKKIRAAELEIDGLVTKAFTMDHVGRGAQIYELEEHYDYSTVKGKRVLLVEDNALNREITKDLLEDNGLTVEEAEDGDIAVRMVMYMEPGYYDFILMDIQMPRMDGYEAAREIRGLDAEHAKVPIIAMTANAFDVDRDMSYAAGMDAHLSKPVSAEMLLKTLARFK